MKKLILILLLCAMVLSGCSSAKRKFEIILEDGSTQSVCAYSSTVGELEGTLYFVDSSLHVIAGFQGVKSFTSEPSKDCK